MVEFDEFIKLMEERIDMRTMGPDQKDMFREAFKVFDKDGNGKISAEELRFNLSQISSGQSYEQFTIIIYESRVVIWAIF